MSSPSPSSSPRWDSAWDNRNSGFISPSQLQLWRQQQQEKQHDFRSQPAESSQSPGSSQPSMFRTTSKLNPSPAQGSASPEPPPTHSRTMSHFSFFSLKSKTNHNSQPSAASVATLPSPARAGRVDEFGSQARPADSALSQTLPRNESAVAQGNGATSPAAFSEQPAGDRPTPPPPGPPVRSSTGTSLTSPLPQLHPEIRSVIGLILAHGRKIYFSGPVVHHDEREPDGVRSKDDGWHDVWAQLSGTTLSLWDMKEIEEASKEGRQVPPKYINIQDAFVAVLGSVTIPGTTNTPPRKYTNVLTLNTAGVNLKLFACPSTPALLSWTAALRLAAFEKARLEEIYTAHLLRTRIENAASTPTPLSNGRMECRVRARISGRTDWKTLWMVVSAGLGGHSRENGSVSSLEQKPIQATKKNRLSALFNREHSPPRGPATARPTIQFFNSNKPKDLKRALLTVRDVTQAFAVYPERPNLIDTASLLKIEGSLGDEEAAGSMRNREGWVLIIPEPDTKGLPAAEMRKLLIGIHDAFALYGRPRMYNWDPRDPRGMMFAYPVGENKDALFLDRELAENLDPRDDRTSANRAQMQHILWDRMRGSPPQSQSPTSVGNTPPTLPPLPDMALNGGEQSSQFSSAPSPSQPMQLPPLQFERSRNDYELPAIPDASPATPGRMLTPITEGSDPNNSRSLSGDPLAAAPGQQQQHLPTVTDDPAEPTESNTFLGGNLSSSPLQSPALPSPGESETRRRLSDDSWGFLSASRPESKLEHLPAQSSSSSPNVPSFGGESSKPMSMFMDISHEFGQDSPHVDSTSQPAPELREGSPASQHQATAGSSRLLSLDTGRSSSHSRSPQQRPPMNRQTTASSTQQSQPYLPGSSNSMSLNSGRDSPFRPPSQGPSPAPRFTSTYMNRDASLPPPPHEDEEPVVFHRGVELSDPPSPRFSVLTSPHSVMSSPIADRPPRHSILHGAGPSPRASIASFSNPHPPDTPSPKRPSVQSSTFAQSQSQALSQAQPQAQAPAQARASGPSSAPSVRSVGQSPPTSPPVQSPRHTHSSSASQHKPPSRANSTQDQDILREAGAQYYMRHIQQNQPTGPRRPPPPPEDGEDETESESDSSYSPPNTGPRFTSPPRTNTKSSTASPTFSSPSSYGPARGGTPNALSKGSNTSAPAAPSPERANPAFSPRMASAVRKPSGARAAPVSKTHAQRDLQQQRPPSVHRPPSEVEEDSEENMSDHSDDIPQGQRQLPPRMAAAAAHDDYDDEHGDAVDALAALSYLEIEEPQPPPPPRKSSVSSPPPIPQVVEPRATSPAASQESGIRSSFAPSKHASQRKAQAQAQQAASQAIMNKPGKSGRERKPRDPGAWGESSEEEEDDEEEDDDEVDSDEEPVRRDGRPMDQRSLGPSAPPSVRGVSPGRPAENGGYPQGRQRRDLPQVPPQPGMGMAPEGYDETGAPRRMPPDQYAENGRRSLYPDAPRRQPSPGAPRQPDMFNPGAARQNVWSQALERENPTEPGRDTFVQLEPPSQTMTKAFAPHGLLYAGLQDKQDRSAKRQEELARESGASLINVPHKPPPPQTGLLGAVSAHERERKREGGLGAALTEREREKRMAEERQRKLDDFQKMQLEQMQQGGSMYGGMGMQPQFSGYNPMMNPMMMGMNPMMTGWGGYPGMMNTQHMFAAQQAAQAYQQAMVAFSTAGSQMGGAEGAQPGVAQLSPMMTGNGMMGGYDPRMSMMMPMMTGMNPNMTGMNPNMTGLTPNMTGMAGMNPAMAGMNPSMAGLNPNMTGMNLAMNMGQGMNPAGMGLGMQATGGSSFDVRFPPSIDGGNSQIPSQTSSANGQGSPAGPRSQDPSDEQPKKDDVR